MLDGRRLAVRHAEVLPHLTNSVWPRPRFHRCIILKPDVHIREQPSKLMGKSLIIIIQCQSAQCLQRI